MPAWARGPVWQSRGRQCRRRYSCGGEARRITCDTLPLPERSIERAKDAIVEDLLPALDSFDMATASDSWDAMPEEWKNGMERVHAQLLQALQKNGVTRFGKSDEVFNPAQHEAVQEMEDDGGESHTILKVLRHGYAIGERVIRPAQVILRK